LAIVGFRLTALLGPAVGDGDTALLTEWWIGEDDIHALSPVRHERVGHLYPYLGKLMNRIAEAKETGGYAIPTSITVNAPDLPEVSYKRKG
jgi:hypothetical protein